MSFREALPRRATIGGFVVQELRVFGRAPPFGHGAHDNEPVVGANTHPQLIANPQLLGGFRACAVQVHLAAGDRRR